MAPKKSAANSWHWILFFYSVPSKPVSNRMTVWRKLIKAGAVPLKGAVYILPFSAEHYEFVQWLCAEIKGMNGEAAIVSIDQVDTIPAMELVDLFNQARRGDYLAIGHDLEELSRKVDSIRKGGQGLHAKGLTVGLDKIGKAYAEVRKIDFFQVAEGVALAAALAGVGDELNQLLGSPKKRAQTMGFTPRLAADYQGRVWATRRQPFVDRMACAWLIKRAIDPAAVFTFIDEGEIGLLAATTAVFDIYGGEFTHCGDLCTFEVLLKCFGMKDKALHEIAQLVHDLDLKDGKYQAPGASGVEQVLAGIRKTATDDSMALAQGMQVFEMLFAAQK
jgi:hypothetical protein